MDLEYPGQGPEVQKGCQRWKCLDRGWALGSCCEGCQKKMLPNTQSMRDCSGWASSILVQFATLVQWSDIKSQIMGFLVGKWIGSLVPCEMMELESINSWSLIGRMQYAGRCWSWTNTESIKRSEIWNPQETSRPYLKGVRCQEKGEWVRIERADVLE